MTPVLQITGQLELPVDASEVLDSLVLISSLQGKNREAMTQSGSRMRGLAGVSFRPQNTDCCM